MSWAVFMMMISSSSSLTSTLTPSLLSTLFISSFIATTLLLVLSLSFLLSFLFSNLLSFSFSSHTYVSSLLFPMITITVLSTALFSHTTVESLHMTSSLLLTTIISLPDPMLLFAMSPSSIPTWTSMVVWSRWTSRVEDERVRTVFLNVSTNDSTPSTLATPTSAPVAGGVVIIQSGVEEEGRQRIAFLLLFGLSWFKLCDRWTDSLNGLYVEVEVDTGVP